MKREIVYIDEEICNGCGDCVPNCHEGALRIIDGKARLISDLMCDGLGACIGHCPLGAITMEEREAEPYDEIKVMKDMVSKGRNTIIAHLSHLRDHGQTEYLKEGVRFLIDHQEKLELDVDEILSAVHNGRSDKTNPNKNQEKMHHHNHPDHHSEGAACGCPGSAERTFSQAGSHNFEGASIPSALRHWPVQMHLINPGSPHFIKSDFVLAADCTAFTIGGFHPEFLEGKTLGIACPKLDQGTDIYLQKLISLIEDARINTLTVMIMEVPCCGGLAQLAQMAVNQSSRKIPVKQIVVSVQGEVLAEEWA
jgi:NAD-dependent dihydropyrimidine dehydrogenase PreA subunit